MLKKNPMHPFAAKIIIAVLLLLNRYGIYSPPLGRKVLA